MPIRPRICGPEVQPSLPLVEGHLHIALTVDDGGDPRLVTQDDLDAWGTSLDVLIDVARQRLLLESGPSDWIDVETVPGMIMLVGGDERASNRILVMDHMLREWPLGGVVVVVPAADQLLAVPMTEVSQLDALHVMITAAHYAHGTSSVPITDQAFWTNGQEWHTISIRHTESEVHIEPPAALLDVIGQLASMGMVAVAGEA
jgi:hypothetical protein